MRHRLPGFSMELWSSLIAEFYLVDRGLRVETPAAGIISSIFSVGRLISRHLKPENKTNKIFKREGTPVREPS
jgi:hypothetical protein